jgi:hypothetical protein
LVIVLVGDSNALKRSLKVLHIAWCVVVDTQINDGDGIWNRSNNEVVVLDMSAVLV